MSHDIKPIPIVVPSPVRSTGDVMEEFLAGKNPNTVEAYRYDLTNFAHWLTKELKLEIRLGPGEAANWLMASDHGSANRFVGKYKAALVGEGKAPATINRRLAALRSMVRLAGQHGDIAWSLDVQGEKTASYRDTKGPPEADRDRLMDSAELRARLTHIGKRNLAIIKLLFNPALRRAEAISLDLVDVDLEMSAITLIRKGKKEPKRMSIPSDVRDALRDWISVRGDEPGPVFVRLDPAGLALPTFERLSLGSVNRMLVRLCKDSGIKRRIWPHGLRHAGITAALETTKGDVRGAQKFSGHSNIQTLMMYDDNRRDDAGNIAQQIANADAERRGRRSQ